MNADNAEVLRSGGSSGVAGISTFMSRTPGEWRNVGQKEVPCDPSTKNDAGRTPASQSVQAYRGMLPAGRGGVRSLLQAPTRPVGAGTDPTVPGTPVYRPEIGRQHGRTTSFGSPVLLRQDPEAELER